MANDRRPSAESMEAKRQLLRDLRSGGWGRATPNGREHYFGPRGPSACGMVGRDPSVKLKHLFESRDNSNRCARCRVATAELRKLAGEAYAFRLGAG